MPRNALRLCLVLLASLVLTASCTDPDDGTPAAPTPPVAPTDPAASPGESPAATEDVFAEDDVILDVAIKEPSTVDPMRIQDPGSFIITRQLFEGLTRWDSLEEQVVPGVAEGWRSTQQGRRWLFRLREGMTFHDGTPVTAADFVFAFDRIAQRANASELAYTLERIAGFDAVNRRGRGTHMVGLEAIDERTLSILLTEPYQDLPALLTHPALVPLPKHAVDDLDNFLSAPVGNGAFQIAQAWAPGQPVVLRSFAGFIDTPEIDGIRFLPYPDAASSWIEFVRGDLHVTEVPVGQFKAALDVYGDRGFQPLLAGYYFGLNVRSPNLSNRRLRIAINRAVNRQRIAEDIFKKTLDLPRGVVPRGMPGFIENACGSLCNHSLTAARSTIRRVPRRQRAVTLQYTRGDPHDQVALAVRRDLEAAGLRVRVQAFPFSEYLKRLRAGRHNIYRLGWLAEYPVPDVFLNSLFSSQSPDNHSGFSSRRFDRLLARAHREPSPDVRIQLYVEAERLVLSAAPIVPIGSFVSYWAAQPSVEEIVFDPLGGFDAVDVSLATDD